jgi:hypothetical protein
MRNALIGLSFLIAVPSIVPSYAADYVFLKK